jgi:hypothetical protein
MDAGISTDAGPGFDASVPPPDAPFDASGDRPPTDLDSGPPSQDSGTDDARDGSDGDAPTDASDGG